MRIAEHAASRAARGAPGAGSRRRARCRCSRGTPGRRDRDGRTRARAAASKYRIGVRGGTQAQHPRRRILWTSDDAAQPSAASPAVAALSASRSGGRRRRRDTGARHAAEVPAERRDLGERARCLSGGASAASDRVHHLLEPLVQSAAQKVHLVVAERAQKHPGLRRVRAALGVEHDRLVAAGRASPPASRARRARRSEHDTRRTPPATDVDHAQPGAPILDPARQLDRGDVIVLVLDRRAQRVDVDLCRVAPAYGLPANGGEQRRAPPAAIASQRDARVRRPRSSSVSDRCRAPRSARRREIRRARRRRRRRPTTPYGDVQQLRQRERAARRARRRSVAADANGEPGDEHAARTCRATSSAPSPRPVAAATHDVPGHSPPIAKPTPNTRPPTSCGNDVRLRHVDARQIEHAEPAEPERAEHRGDDRAEHHLEHGEVGEIELAGELARAAHAGALEAPAERDADDQRRDERAASPNAPTRRTAPLMSTRRRTSGATRVRAANAPIMNSQLPTLSSAPPVSAWPLVQPRASTAPRPITAPPANAATSRASREMRGPRSTSRRSRPASHADAHAADRRRR